MQGMLVAVLALAGVEPPVSTEDPAATATAMVANQHVAISVLAAMYHCENGRWPDTVETVQAFHARSELPLPVTPDWRLFAAEASGYTLEEDVLTVTTIAGAAGDALRVVSTNRPPGCADRRLKVNTTMHVGDQVSLHPEPGPDAGAASRTGSRDG